ncbi:MAG: DUF61 family protein [Staphylothermus sp.]|nr:DUF61 family protein [Staphylothermus sp.]
MSNEKDLFNKLISVELRLINKHLPYKRVSLCDLLKMDIPYIVLRDGTVHLIDKEELLYLSKLLGEEACKLKIPIIIETAPSIGEGAYIVRDHLAKKVIATILGIDYILDKPLVIYRPQLYIIREKLRTTTTILFNLE